jgi:hypothetical protein
LYRLISGSVTVAIVAAVALVDPDIAENPAQAPMVAIARPPLKLPINTYTESYNLLLIPEWKAICPINTKRGITVKL